MNSTIDQKIQDRIGQTLDAPWLDNKLGDMHKDRRHETVAMQNALESLIADAKEAQPELEYPFRGNTCSSKPAIDTKGTKPAWVFLQSPGTGMVF